MSQNRKSDGSRSIWDPPSLRFPFSLIQTLGVAVVILDLEGRITHFNSAAEVYSGYRSNEVLGKRPWEFLISQEDATVHELAFETLKSTGLQTEMDTVWKIRDGSERIFHWSNAPVLDENGKLRWIVDVFADVTAERESKIQLQNAKQELEIGRQINQFLAEASYRMYTSSMVLEKRLEVLTSLPVPSISDWSFAVLHGQEPGIFLKSVYHWKNTEGRNTWGHNTSDIATSNSISKLLSWKDDTSIPAFISNAHSCTEGKTSNPLDAQTPEQWTILKSLGWRYWICIPIEGFHPRTQGAILLASNSENRTHLRNSRQVAEEYIRRVSPLLDQASLYEETIHAVQLRDEFISAASHELRTPLTSLRMQLELLMNQPNAEFITSEKGQRLIALADQQLARISKLVLNMLETVYLSKGKINLKYEKFDLLHLVRNVVNQLSVAATLKGVNILIETDTPVTGSWDWSRLEQVVSNLLMNAINFGQSQPVHVRITSSLERACIVVEDHGKGIPATDIQRIFEQFQQVSSLASGGLGLGLYIARQITQAHGGNITVESQVNKGSRFTVDLPRHPP